MREHNVCIDDIRVRMKIPIDERYLLIGVQELFVVALLTSCSALQFAVRLRSCWRACLWEREVSGLGVGSLALVDSSLSSEFGIKNVILAFGTWDKMCRWSCLRSGTSGKSWFSLSALKGSLRRISRIYNLEYNFYLFLFLIGTTPIATDFWSDLDKQGDYNILCLIALFLARF